MQLKSVKDAIPSKINLYQYLLGYLGIMMEGERNLRKFHSVKRSLGHLSKDQNSVNNIFRRTLRGCSQTVGINPLRSSRPTSNISNSFLFRQSMFKNVSSFRTLYILYFSLQLNNFIKTTTVMHQNSSNWHMLLLLN